MGFFQKVEINQPKVNTILFLDRMPRSKIYRPSRVDTQIVHRLQAEEQAKEQCQNLQTVGQVNQSLQVLHRQNRQHPSLGQVRCNIYSGYNQAERDLESNQIGQQATRDGYPQEAHHLLQRTEKENLVQYYQAGNSNHNQVASGKCN